MEFGKDAGRSVMNIRKRMIEVLTFRQYLGRCSRLLTYQHKHRSSSVDQESEHWPFGCTRNQSGVTRIEADGLDSAPTVNKHQSSAPGQESEFWSSVNTWADLDSAPTGNKNQSLALKRRSRTTDLHAVGPIWADVLDSSPTSIIIGVPQWTKNQNTDLAAVPKLMFSFPHQPSINLRVPHRGKNQYFDLQSVREPIFSIPHRPHKNRSLVLKRRHRSTDLHVVGPIGPMFPTSFRPVINIGIQPVLRRGRSVLNRIRLV